MRESRCRAASSKSCRFTSSAAFFGDASREASPPNAKEALTILRSFLRFICGVLCGVPLQLKPRKSRSAAVSWGVHAPKIFSGIFEVSGAAIDDIQELNPFWIQRSINDAE